VWGIDPDVVNRVPSNDGVNHIHYSLNPEKKLVTNYVVVGHLLKVVALNYGQLVKERGSGRVVGKTRTVIFGDLEGGGI